MNDLDLARLPRLDRSAAWLSWHHAAFSRKVTPSGAFQGALEGSVSLRPLSGGRLCRIRPAFARLQANTDGGATDAGSSVFTTVVQLAGCTEITGPQASIALQAGDVGFVCCAAFEKRMSRDAELLLLQAPSILVQERQPIATQAVCHRLAPADPGTSLIRDALVGAFRASAALSGVQQRPLLMSLLDLLGVPDLAPARSPESRDHRRVQQALALIRTRHADPDFTATSLADSMFISRRRLDELFVHLTGQPVARCIWDHRLRSAGRTLHDPAHAWRTVTDIALSHGFESAAHFSRSFKARYGVTPLQWRASRNGPP